MKLWIRGQEVTAAAGLVTLEKSRRDTAAVLTCRLWTAPADRYFPDLTLAVGDAAVLRRADGTAVFTGAVQEVRRTPEQVQLTAYDRGVYLSRNEISGVFCGSGGEIVRAVAARLGIAVGAVDAQSRYQTIVTRSGTAASAVLRQAAGEDREIAMEGEVLTVRRSVGEPVPLPTDRILAASCAGSIRRMVNRGVVLSRKGTVLARQENTGDVRTYGQLQAVRTLSGTDAAAQARELLRRLEKTAEVTVLGDLNLRCGGLVQLTAGWGLSGRWRAAACRHCWQNGVFTTELTLEEPT